MAFFGFFSRGKSKNSNEPRYDSKLIRRLRNDHRRLIDMINEIDEDVRTDQFGEARKRLYLLKLELLSHFMEEDLRLYWYLKKRYRDTDVIETVQMFEETIKGIQKRAIAFADRYSRESSRFDASFTREFKQIAFELQERIAIEERSLYTLYTR